ncbi:UNVERIFIED_CONTAM: DUF1033 family protein [Streptococcus canis]|uniref:DNA binding protein n=1 Tax=Streptococcus canis FSL Z3-227 TaxID=482234 RepID=A0AAV3FPR9_STRCB|nr:DUF1033 family protein [Streptococcus canis]EIQ80958.1 Putative DNA binding protein [Streptococcus canis FSL Z3-227]MDV5987462.1 DUF1033 family protein [Streptococcus canis]MDV5993482.1 DUF1033 family protein [Streptococcus canis]MDV6021528.1 DUF1033 family protein [Streptococcus canis]QJD11514.1 DUF1033 family protein [Streptococcus canis]
MYQVIKMYGDWEPWWFIEGWQDDIVAEERFDDWQEALAYFEQEWQSMRNRFPSYHSQKNLLATFWEKNDTRWCEDCDDDLQQYHSLLLLKNRDIVPNTHYLSHFEQRNDSPQTTYLCKLKL